MRMKKTCNMCCVVHAFILLTRCHLRCEHVHVRLSFLREFGLMTNQINDQDEELLVDKGANNLKRFSQLQSEMGQELNRGGKFERLA